uniref:Rab-GAP TBC domain-containing protein n=1 Tax=Globodera rostochiensis TaxID=31243 RepID=A0A914GW09_GLORO
MPKRTRMLGRRFLWTEKRLRTENRLLRQRIDYLERESSALADRLVRGQVDLAQQADACLNISHELNTLRDINSEAHRRLEDAYETIRELSCKRAKDKIDQGAQIDDTSMIEHIHQLQQELIEAHTKKADLENIAREFRRRTQELESANKRLKECPPDGGIALIQEELIQVKMREAEASLSLKEMRQKLAEVEQQWTRFMNLRGITAVQLSASPSVSLDIAQSPPPSSMEEEPPQEPCQSPTPPSSNQQNTQQPQQNPSQSARARIAKLTATLMGAVGSNANINNSSAISESGGTAETLEGWSQRELEDNFIGLKIREADTVAELKEMRQKVMEMETQNHVCTNQLKRQDEEIRRLREERDTFVQMERELREELRDNERKLVVSQSEMKEKNVMQRLKYTEALQAVAELKQQIAQLESKNAEKAARAQIRGSSVYGLDNESLASSTRSVASLDGIQSLPSEEMAAFIAGIKSGKNRRKNEDEEEDEGAETETNEAEEDARADLCAEEGMTELSNGRGPVSRRAAARTPEESPDNNANNKSHRHNETSDSGLSLQGFLNTNHKHSIMGSIENKVEVSIRVASNDGNDAEVLRSLIQELANFQKMSDGPKLSANHLREHMKNGAANALIAAVTEGNETTDLYIRPMFRRRKAGSGFMSELMKISRDLSCDAMHWNVLSDNDSAICFYKSLGAQDLTFKRSDGLPELLCWRIESADYDKAIRSSKDTLPDIKMTVVMLNDVTEENAVQLIECWKSLDVFSPPFAAEKQFTKMLRDFRFGVVQAQNMTDDAVLGMALFHRCAFSTWTGPYITIDSIRVRPDHRRRGIGKKLSTEIVRIAMKHFCSRIGWTARADSEAKAFFNTMGAINLTEKEGWLLFQLIAS